MVVPPMYKDQLLDVEQGIAKRKEGWLAADLHVHSICSPDVFPLKDFNAIVAEIGFTSQPSGGNEFADVTWAPIFYLTIGYEFGG